MRRAGHNSSTLLTYGIEEDSEEKLPSPNALVQLLGASRVLVVEYCMGEETTGLARQHLKQQMSRALGFVLEAATITKSTFRQPRHQPRHSEIKHVFRVIPTTNKVYLNTIYNNSIITKTQG